MVWIRKIRLLAFIVQCQKRVPFIAHSRSTDRNGGNRMECTPITSPCAKRMAASALIRCLFQRSRRGAPSNVLDYSSPSSLSSSSNSDSAKSFSSLSFFFFHLKNRLSKRSTTAYITSSPTPHQCAARSTTSSYSSETDPSTSWA